MAAAGFRVRRITSEQSIGDKLKRARTRKKITVTEVEEATKIRAKFILALESDSWEQIPSEVYGRGYLETYAQYLHLSVETIMKQYARERESYARHCKDAKIELAPKAQIRVPRITVTPRFVACAVALVALLGVGGGIALQVKKFTSAPYLHLVTPAEAKTVGGTELIVGAQSVTVSGKTAIGASVSVNGEQVGVNPDGSFSTSVKVQKGLNSITVEAESGNGKTTSEIIPIEVR